MTQIRLKREATMKKKIATHVVSRRFILIKGWGIYLQETGKEAAQIQGTGSACSRPDYQPAAIKPETNNMRSQIQFSARLPSRVQTPLWRWELNQGLGARELFSPRG